MIEKVFILLKDWIWDIETFFDTNVQTPKFIPAAVILIALGIVPIVLLRERIIKLKNKYFKG